MIAGIGTDIIDIERVHRMLSNTTGDRFMRRVLTDAEYSICIGRPGRVAEFVAGRFAAKEAVVKGLGCGIGKDVSFHDIEILPDKQGKPHVRLSDNARANLRLQDHVKLHITISHTATNAVAFAVVEYAE